MPSHFISFLRYLAAALITASGLAHIAALWLRPLTELALFDALLGAGYLLIGIGLSGRSRFSLFLGIVIPGSISGYIYYTLGTADSIYLARVVVDVMVVVCCTTVLWRVRNNPSI